MFLCILCPSRAYWQLVKASDACGQGGKSCAFEMPWKSEKCHIVNKQTEEKRKRQTLVVVIDPGNEKSIDFACCYPIIQ